MGGENFRNCIDNLGFLSETKKAYESIEWSSQVRAILDDVERKAKKFKKFVAIHLRGADAIFGKLKIAPEVSLYGRLFPYEIALDIIIKEMKQGNDVVVFGQDFEGNKILVDYIKNLKIQEANITCIDDLLDINYNNAQRSFFEVNLLSKAFKIHATGYSQFSGAALDIAGKNMLISFYDIYSTQELYNIMLKNINTLNLHPLQKAYAWYRIYDFSKQLNLDVNQSLEYVKKALSYDEDNDAFRIAIIDCLFKMHKYDEIEELLKYIVNTRLKKFEAALYGPHTVFWWTRNFYNDIYQKYLNFENKQNYPYISFVAALISRCDKIKDIKNGEIYYQYAIKKEPKNKVFFIIWRNNARHRIHSHLAYKLGQALIAHTKSFKDCITLPFIINHIRSQYKQEQKMYKRIIKQNPSLKLPSLEACIDYSEALKEKQCFTYRLGETFIKACKNWYKGSLIKFYFQARRLEQEFKKKS